MIKQMHKEIEPLEVEEDEEILIRLPRAKNKVLIPKITNWVDPPEEEESEVDNQ